jgi:large subunit ribosomal protein L31e
MSEIDPDKADIEGENEKKLENMISEDGRSSQPLTEEDEDKGKIEGKKKPNSIDEEVKPSKEEKPQKEIVEERVYLIPLSKVWITSSKKRAPKAMRLNKNFVNKHMKLEASKGLKDDESKKLLISSEINEKVWSRGIEKPPRKIRVRVTKDEDGDIAVYLA